MTAPTKSPYVTGHCSNGAHEGQRVLSPGGALLTACRGEYEYRFVRIKCNCFCHEMYAMLRSPEFDALDVSSIDTPGADMAASVDPVPFDVAASPSVTATTASDDEHRVYRKLLADGTVSAQLTDLVRELVFKESPSEPGEEKTVQRRRRGELEANVEVVCRLWVDKLIPWPQLTTDIIGLMIDADDQPSAGAIYAVLTRWKDHALANIETKPMRFVSFTDSVAKVDIASVLGKFKREGERRAKGFF